MPKRWFYWDEIIGDKDIRAEYSETIDKLSVSPKAAELDLKKSTAGRLYTIKINDDDRLLFTTIAVDGKQFLLVLEVILNHDYIKSKFLHNPAALRHFVDNWHDAIRIAENTFEQNDGEFLQGLEETKENTPPKPIHYFNQQFLEFSDAQNEVLKKALPLIVTGPPGSGKTCVALDLLKQRQQHIAASATEEIESESRKKLLYITQSKELVDKMREMWQLNPNVLPVANVEVEFKTIDEFWKAHNSKLSSKAQTTANDFASWLQQYLRDPKNKNFGSKNKKNKSTSITDSIFANPDKVYQEFRILSGYQHFPKHYDYINNLGAKRTLFETSVERAAIANAYNAYIKHLQDFHLFDLSFEAFNLDQPSPYDFIVIDESQDLSLLQLSTITDCATDMRICFCFDTHQSLNDTQSIYPYLDDLFFKREIKLSEVLLPTSYRCPRQIIDYANALLDIKNSLVGSADKKEQSRIELSASETPDARVQVAWYDSTDADKIKELQKLTSAGFAVVTQERFKDDARRQFPNALIFTAETIKGLEYQSILLYRLFENETCSAAAKELNLDNLRNGNVHRPKPDKDINPQYRPFFNQLFTAMTRTTENLYIYQKHEHGIKKITQHMEAIANNLTKEVKEEHFTVSTQEDWIKQVKLLWERENRQAREIIIREKLDDVPEIQQLLNPSVLQSVPAAKPAAVGNEVELTPPQERSSESRRINKVGQRVPVQSNANQTKDICDFLQTLKQLSTAQTVQKKLMEFLNKKNAITLLYVFDETQGERQLPVICMFVIPNENKELKLLSSGFLRIINDQKNWGLTIKIFSSEFFYCYAESDNSIYRINPAAYAIMNPDYYELIPRIIRHHLTKNTPTLPIILENLFLSDIENNQKGEKAFISLLLGLCERQQHHPLIAALIRRKYSELNSKQLINQLLQPSELARGIPPLMLLAQSTQFVTLMKTFFLDKSFKQSFYETIRIEHLFQPYGPENFLLFISLLNTPESKVFLDELILKIEISGDQLLKQFFDGNTPFAVLASYSIDLIKQVLEKNDQLIMNFTPKHLFVPLTLSNGSQSTMFARLSASEKGIALLKFILERNVNIVKEITVEQLFSVANFRDKPTFNLLRQCQAGYDVIEILCRKNSTLAEGIKKRTRSLSDSQLKEILAYLQLRKLREITKPETNLLAKYLKKEIDVSNFMNQDLAESIMFHAEISGYDDIRDTPIHNILQKISKYKQLVVNPSWKNKLFCKDFFSAAVGRNGVLHPSGAVLALSYPDIYQYVVDEVTFYLKNNTEILPVILDNLFVLIPKSSENGYSSLITNLLLQCKDEEQKTIQQLVLGLINQKYKNFTEEAFFNELFNADELTANLSPIFFLTSIDPGIKLIKTLFNQHPNFYQYLTINQLFRINPPNIYSYLLNNLVSDIEFLSNIFHQNPVLAKNMEAKHQLILIQKKDRKSMFLSDILQETEEGRKLYSYIFGKRHSYPLNAEPASNPATNIFGFLNRTENKSPHSDALAKARELKAEPLIKSLEEKKYNLALRLCVKNTKDIQSKFIAMIDLLLPLVTDIDERTQSLPHQTALHFAAASGLQDIYKKLIDNGADEGLEDDNGKTPKQLLDETLGNLHSRLLKN